MSEKPTSRVSLAKFGSPNPAADGVAPPQKVVYAVGALVLTAIAALGSAASLFGAKDQLLTQALISNAKLKTKDRSTRAEIIHQVDITPRGILLQTAVVAVALLFVARSTYRGKYWARWGVLGLWVLATFVQTVPGFANSILGVAGSTPIFYKSLAFISGVSFVAAVILTSMRSSVDFFNRNKPARAAGQARRGLFASRASMLSPAAPPPTKPVKRSAASGKVTSRGNGRAATSVPERAAQPDRSKSKVRANTDSVAKGADLARSRAKAASKSRRTSS